MKPLTLFDAYACATDDMHSTVAQRGTQEGIAVDNDPSALFWQRRERLAQKIAQRLHSVLGNEGVLHVCIICNCDRWTCYCNDGFRPKKAFRNKMR